MNIHRSPEHKKFWLIFITLFFLMGCKVEKKEWIEKMISEVESAWVKADNAGLGKEGRETAASNAAKIYFRPGMPEEEAFKLLKEMKEHGFEIRESRHEGARDWPEKAISPWESAFHPDPATMKNLKLQYQKGASYFTIKKVYGRERIVIRKTIAISFTIPDQTRAVEAVEATVWADSI